MDSCLKLSTLALTVLIMVHITLSSAKNIGQPEKVLYPSEFDLVDDDGSVDAALLNYMYGRMMFNRLRNNLDISDLQRKRSYYKQCAFNAVSCFGKK